VSEWLGLFNDFQTNLYPLLMRASVPKCVCVTFYRGVTSIFVVSSWIVVRVILKSYCPLPKPPSAASLTPKPATGNLAADTRRITVALTTQNMLETLVRLTNPGPLPKNWHACCCFWFVWISSLAPVTKRFVPYKM